MKKSKIIIPVLFWALLSSAFQVKAAVFFSDSFETGNRTHSENNFSWDNTSPAAVVSGQGRTDNYALRFRYNSNTPWQEQRFTMGASGVTDVYIQYYIKFPANYIHASTGGANNNKMIRFWRETYGDNGQIGASAFAYGLTTPNISEVIFETAYTGCGGGVGVYDPYLDNSWFITSNDLNKWLRFEWHFKPDTGGGNGAIQLWVDGELKISYTNLNIGCDVDYLRHGYLLGHANSGFSQQTDIYIDDVVIADSYIGDRENASLLPPPNILVETLP